MEGQPRHYENHRTNTPPVDRPIEPKIQHYRLWHKDTVMTIDYPPEDQPDSGDEFEDYLIEIKDYQHVYRGWKYLCELCQELNHHSHIVKNKSNKQLRSWDIVAKSYLNAKQAVEAEPAMYTHNRQEYDETQRRRQVESSSMGAGWVNSNR